MARPRKTGLDYFPFDVGFFDSEKIACIAGEFGIKGEVVAIRLLCAIYKDKGYFAEWNEQLQFKLSREMQGVSADLIRQIVARLAKWGFFDESLLNSAQVLTSLAIQRRYFEAVKLRKIDYETLERRYILDPKIINSMETAVNSKETLVNSRINATNKIKLNKKEDKSSQKGSEAEDELKRMIEEYKGDFKQIWRSDIAAKYNLDLETICGLLDDFYLDMRCQETKVRNLPYLFSLWLNERMLKGNKNESNQTDRFSARRGTEPTTAERKGFKGTF